jgi:hypothetical protein
VDGDWVKLMPMFVHLAPESRLKMIQRNGIGRLRKTSGNRPAGIFAMPVTRNFYVSHQWLRELKRKGQGPIFGVYFRIPDVETVYIGHYNRRHRGMTAKEAVAEFMTSESREGWEVVIPRRIAAKEVRRIQALPQVMGWRYFPGAKGSRPFCTCKFCTRSKYGAARLRARLESPS